MEIVNMIFYQTHCYDCHPEAMPWGDCLLDFQVAVRTGRIA